MTSDFNWGNWGREKLSNLPKVTDQVPDRAGMWTQAFGSSVQTLYPCMNAWIDGQLLPLPNLVSHNFWLFFFFYWGYGKTFKVRYKNSGWCVLSNESHSTISISHNSGFQGRPRSLSKSLQITSPTPSPCRFRHRFTPFVNKEKSCQNPQETSHKNSKEPGIQAKGKGEKSGIRRAGSSPYPFKGLSWGWGGTAEEVSRAPGPSRVSRPLEPGPRTRI